MPTNFTREDNDALDKQVREATSPTALYALLQTHLREHPPTTEDQSAQAASPMNATTRSVPAAMHGAKFFQIAYRGDYDRVEIAASDPKEFAAKLEEAKRAGFVW